MNSRVLKAIRAEFVRQGVDGVLLSNPVNISYLCGYRCRDSYLIVAREKCFYLTDFRYIEEASRNIKGCCIKNIDSSLLLAVKKICTDLNMNKLAFEAESFTFGFYQRATLVLANQIKLVPFSQVIENSRRNKTAEELLKIRKAVQIVSSALRYAKRIKLYGRREKEIAAELEQFMLFKGADGPAFDIIVASGPNSSQPHHLTSRRRVGSDEVVLIDIGADFSGYKSDLTRVFFSGKITPLAKRIYETVLGAQERALAAVKPGVRASAVDTCARDFIAEQGYGECFGHSLGHGVGLEVHELPRISGKSDTVLSEGMIFTVEPAVYLPGKLGIRLEDMVMITGKGSEVLSVNLNKRI